MLDEGIHIICHFRIESGDRFVEQQYFPRRTECACKQNSLLLSAGELTIAAVRIFRDSHALYVLARHPLFFFRVKWMELPPRLASGKYNFPDRGRKISLHDRLLRQIPDFSGSNAVTCRDGPGHRTPQVKDCLHQRGFSRSVLTDYTQVISFIHFKTQVADKDVSLVTECQIFA